MEFEQYSDPLDVASRNESIATTDAIRIMQLAAKPYQSPRKEVISGVEVDHYEITSCLECGDPIGEMRLRVSIKNTFCIVCASAQEGTIR